MPWVKGEEYCTTGDELIEVMDENNIDKAVCCSNPVVGERYSIANDYIANEIKKYPDRLFGFCRIDPRLILDPQLKEYRDPPLWKKVMKKSEENPDIERIGSSWVFKEINRCIKKFNFKGIKLHPVVEAFAPDNPIFELIFQLAINLGVPVQIHCDRVCNFTGNPRRILELAKNFPDLKICAIHLYAEDTIKILSQEKEKIKNIYIEISEVAKGRLIKKAIKEFGDDRVIFGSDYPFGDPNIILAILKELKLDDETLEKILSKNALSLLGK